MYIRRLCCAFMLCAASAAAQDLYVGLSSVGYDCGYKHGLPGDCGEVVHWSGGQLIPVIQLDNTFHGDIIAAGGDAQGTGYALTSIVSYDLQSYLLRGNQAVAAFPEGAGDVAVGPDGAVYVAVGPAYYYGGCEKYASACGTIYRWTAEHGAEKVLDLQAGDGVGAVLSVAVTPDGHVLACTDADDYAAHFGGALLVDGQTVLTFEDTPVDLDVADDATIYVATLGEFTSCNNSGVRCGKVLRWTIGGPPPVQVLSLADDSLGVLTSVAAVDATTFYAGTAAVYSDSPVGRILDSTGQVVQVFDQDVVDLDRGDHPAPPPAPPGVTVYVMNRGDYSACEYHDVYCPAVDVWQAAVGPMELMPIDVPYNQELVAVGADLAGHHYAVTNIEYYDAHPLRGQLMVDGQVVASFDEFPVDAEVAPDGRVFIATEGDFYDCEDGTHCGHVYLWLDGAGPVEVAALDTGAFGHATSVAVDADSNIYLGTYPGYYSYGDKECFLLRNGEPVATFRADMVADVDVAPDGTVYIATERNDYYIGCDEPDAPCGGVWSWTAATGKQLLFQLDDDDWGTVSGVAVDAEGNWYLSTGAKYGSDQGVLFKNGNPIAAFIGAAVDIDAAIFPLDPAPGAFADLGFGCPGSVGPLSLIGLGTLVPDGTDTLLLSGAAPSATAPLILGTSLGSGTFKGCPFPVVPAAILPLATDALGQVLLVAHAPAGVPPGAQVDLQFFVQDGGVPGGWSSSNVLQGIFP